MRRLLLIVLLIATILIVSDNLMPDNMPTKRPGSAPAVTQEPQNPDENLGLIAVPEGWKLYSDSSLGFRINYPETLEFEENGDFSVLFMPAENPVGNEPPTFLYISVIPASEVNAQGTVYNYRREDYERLYGISLNSSTSLTENRELDEWYKYTRLADREIAGKTARQFVNEKPWEFPAGTTETRYLFGDGDKKYILGAYFQGNNAALSKQTISDMLDSFSILSGQEILE